MKRDHGRRARRVIFFAPDRHLEYDGRTPDKSGVGGGVTARLRLASCLAAEGWKVDVVCNCRRRSKVGGVAFVPLEAFEGAACDLLILSSSGGDLDLTSILDADVTARIRTIWVQGIAPLVGLARVPFDYLVAPSNFVREHAEKEWGIPPEKLQVVCNGAARVFFSSAGLSRKDPFRLSYSSHPSKGLAAAIEILRLLRRRDERFTLHVYGGNELWGGAGDSPAAEPGVVFHGMVGQRRLARELRRSSFHLNLQARKEPFALAPLEAMAAGNVVLASPVGGYVELVRSGINGFLIPGDHREPEAWEIAADLVRKLTAFPSHAEGIRARAKRSVPSWPTLARTWIHLAEWMIDGSGFLEDRALGSCATCDGSLLFAADGFHCTGCGRYTPLW